MANNRVRKVDVSTLPVEQIEGLSKQLSGKVEARLNDVKAELDKVLGIYGLTIDIDFQVKLVIKG